VKHARSRPRGWRQAAARTITTPDAEEMKPLLHELAQDVADKLPAGWGFNVLRFEFGDRPGKSLFYIANAVRADVIASMKEFIRRQTQ
jgi:hypothetical protein